MSALKLLVTGFGPFPGVPRNPSAGLAHDIAADPRWRRLDIIVEPLVLETRYAAIETCLIPVIRELRPDAILMLGVAARRRHVGVETRATNRVSRLMPDAEGQIVPHLDCRSGAPRLLRSKAPLVPIMRTMRRQGVDARLSNDAGRYLCNAAYFSTLMEATGGSRAIPTVFIHIPLLEHGGKGARLPKRKYRASIQKMGSMTYRDRSVAQKLHRAIIEACIQLCAAGRMHSERTGKHTAP